MSLVSDRLRHLLARILLLLAGAAFVDQYVQAAEAQATEPGAAAPAPRQMSAKELSDAVRRAEKFFATLKSARHRTFESHELVYDKHGKNLEDYLRDNLLLAEPWESIESHLDTARKALRANDLPAAQGALEVVANRLNEQSTLRSSIEQYWSKLGAHRADRSAYFDNLRRNGFTPMLSPEIETAERELEQQIVARQFVRAMTQTYPRWHELNRQAAEAEASAIEKALADHQKFEPLKVRRNTRICVGPAARSTGPSPVIVRGADPWREVYPEESMIAGEEGMTRLLIKVMPLGCASEVQVLVSSGFARLDDAAMEWALHTRYAPGSIDGQPVESSLYYWMRFDLKGQ